MDGLAPAHEDFPVCVVMVSKVSAAAREESNTANAQAHKPSTGLSAAD